MKRILNWLFPIKRESKEEQDKRMAEINATFNELEKINSEIKRNEKELAALDKYLKS